MLTEEFLRECEDRAHNADPTKSDIIISDLRHRINALTQEIRRMYSLVGSNNIPMKNKNK